MFNLFNKRSFGAEGEKLAAKYLRGKGYEILEMNYGTKQGEIDIIASKDGRIVFIEVKRRSSDRFGKGYEAVNSHKQQQIINTANYYLKKNNQKALCRFDVISLDGDDIKHIENAFGC